MRNLVIYIADLILILLCLLGFYQVFEKAGLPIVFEHNSLVVENIKNNEIPLITYDELISIDNRRVSSQEELEFLLDSKAIGQKVSISILRKGLLVQEKVILESYYSLRYKIIQVFVTGIFIFIAIFVYIKRKEDNVALIFNLVLISAALIISSTWGRFSIEPIWMGQLSRIVFSTAYAFAAVLFFHFTLLFPNKKTLVPANVIKLMYSIGLLLSVMMSYSFFIASAKLNLYLFNVYNSLFNYTRIFFALCAVLSLANIVHSYVTLTDETERRKMRWILLGLFLGPLTLITLWIIPQIITSRGIIEEDFILLAMLSVPISFAVSIVKYHVLNIDEVFKRGTVYILVFFLVLLIYTLIVGLTAMMVGTLTVNLSLIVSTIAAIVIAALFNPIKEKVQLFVDKKFFHVSYNYREAEKEYIEKLKFCYDEISLCRVTNQTIQNILPNNCKQYLLISGENAKITKQQTEYFVNNNLPAALIEQIEYGASYNKVSKDFFENDNIVIAFRIFSDLNGLLGLLLLGEKKSGFRYNLEDIDLLQVFCHQAALALDRINLQGELIKEQIEKTRLKELNELKSYFVSTVSHELKTPLTSIKMFTEIIEDSESITVEKRNEYLKIIKGESARLARLIDNVLDISKIEKGIKEYHKKKINLNICVEDAIQIMEYQINLNGFELKTNLDQDKTEIFADYDSIVEVVVNLLSNSIKYSSKKKKIIVETIRKKDSRILSVEDYGSGISEADIKKIFEPFERASNQHNINTAGTGLGLAIVKHIAEAHNANLEVYSKVGIGSKFSLTFPNN